jgi:DNA-directed RNA polymerase specialized sigma24 family protein
MAVNLTPSDLKIFHRAARQATKRLARQFGLLQCDCDDIYQSLLLELLTRYDKGFDPERGCLSAFATVVARNGASGLGGRLRRHRTLFARVSLDDPISEGDGATLGGTFADGDGYLAWVGGAEDAIGALETHLSLESALRSLPAEELRFCRGLVNGLPGDSRGRARWSRATQHRKLGSIRLRLLAAGLDPQMDRRS